MATSTAAPEVGELSEVVRWQARAEWFELDAMLRFRDAEMVRTEYVEPPMRRLVERSAIALTIGEAAGLSEGQVQHRLAAAERVRDQTPTVWEAFADGLVDWSRVRDISATITQLKRAESVHRLERLVIGYATDHTSAELRAWLGRFVRRVEADLAVERADAERDKRHVAVTHSDDSMGWLNAYLPSHELAAVQARLRKTTRTSVDPDDERTVAQREADQLVAWCTESDAATSAVNANIAVTIDADVLAGSRPGFAESSDGRWGVPAAWVATVAGTGNVFWHRIVVDRVTDDVLSHEYLGRFAPDVLNIALQFLHGTCQAPGCRVPAEHCDTDHREPWPEGHTTASNLGPLCRRHHTYKGHGVLHWSTGPPPAREVIIDIGHAPIHIEHAA